MIVDFDGSRRRIFEEKRASPSGDWGDEGRHMSTDCELWPQDLRVMLALFVAVVLLFYYE